MHSARHSANPAKFFLKERFEALLGQSTAIRRGDHGRIFLHRSARQAAYSFPPTINVESGAPGSRLSMTSINSMTSAYVPNVM